MRVFARTSRTVKMPVPVASGVSVPVVLVTLKDVVRFTPVPYLSSVVRRFGYRGCCSVTSTCNGIAKDGIAKDGKTLSADLEELLEEDLRHSLDLFELQSDITIRETVQRISEEEACSASRRECSQSSKVNSAGRQQGFQFGSGPQSSSHNEFFNIQSTTFPGNVEINTNVMGDELRSTFNQLAKIGLTRVWISVAVNGRAGSRVEELNSEDELELHGGRNLEDEKPFGYH
ncbi:hypothetical protein L218DRAFT_984684 [Marasmius fiardii PR-910]|nr:hypothetical protein L218DRAFT_984684 [Marasmius fiardii PR-910]